MEFFFEKFKILKIFSNEKKVDIEKSKFLVSLLFYCQMQSMSVVMLHVEI